MIAPTAGCVAIGQALRCLCSLLAPLVPRQRLRQTKDIQQLEQSELPLGWDSFSFCTGTCRKLHLSTGEFQIPVATTMTLVEQEVAKQCVCCVDN